MIKVLKDALKEISLSKEEEEDILLKTKEFVKLLSPYIKRKIIVGGSLAKQTLIKKDTQDVDLFVIFENEEETKKLKEYLKKTKLNYMVLHGSRDYFKVEKNGIFFEIVPIVKIRKKKGVKNSTDLSPLHVSYIKRKIKQKKHLKKEIKLAKAFCLAQGVYGAESYIRGFSGYALEVMICYFGKFIKFLKGIQKKRFIDLEKHFKNEEEAKREINEQKILSPIILIDPVYKYRNLCAGLSEESLKILNDASNRFFKRPSVEFFRKKEFDEKDFFSKTKKDGSTILVFHMWSSKEKEDVAATKMKKFFEFLKKEFERKKQKIIDRKFILTGKNTARGYLIANINKKIKIRGPKKNMTDAIKEFKKFRENVFFEKERVFSYEQFNLKKFIQKQKKIAESMGVTFKLSNKKN